MLGIKKILLFTGLLCASLPSVADSILLASGTIQGNGVLAPASWSGTLTLAGSYPTASISNWNISLPPIQASQGTLSALVFTPANSTATLLTQQQATIGLVWFFEFNDAQNQSDFTIIMYNFNPNATNLGATNFNFYQNGVQYVANQGSAILSPVPEPSSGILLATGVAGLAGLATFCRKLFT